MTAGLGDATYLLVSDGEAALVDPQRDAWRFLESAGEAGARIHSVLETHVHNDYVSGAREVAAATGAEIVAPSRGGYAFPHRPAAEGDEVRIGAVRLVAIETPGHTPEHLAWLVYRDGREEPEAVFTGGSLLVGSAGRTDLLGPEMARELTLAQFRTMRRFSALPDGVGVFPTHGAGSFCVAAMPSTRRTSTIGEERRENDVFAAEDQASFEDELSSELMAYPAYYAHMAPMNRAGPRILGASPTPAALDSAGLDERMARGVWVVDGRDREEFAAAHVPGSINIELNSGFASYVGWMLPFGAPFALVLPGPEDVSVHEAMTQLLRIGRESVAGYLVGGFDAWRDDGRGISSYPVVGVADLCQAMSTGEPHRVMDVRQDLESGWGGVPGSMQVFVGDLPGRLDAVPKDLPLWVICSNGHRASIAASMLDGIGAPVRLVAVGGIGEWRARCRDQLAARA